MRPVLSRLRSNRTLMLGALLGVAVALLVLSSIGGASAHIATAGAITAPSTPAPQSPGAPTVSGMSCSVFGFDPCQSLGNAWNSFWNGVSNAASGIWNIVIGIFLYIYGAILGVIVSIFLAITNGIASLLDFAINEFTSLAAMMGIFALPFVVIALVALASGLFLALDFVKDIPVVGAFE